MNLTLSIDKNLLEKSRDAAKKKNTSVNNLVREYLKKLVNESEPQYAAEEFAQIARDSAGFSPDDWKLNRENLYDRY
ncbi:MAG TPA: hypothetical protein DCO79_04775 [Spirochaeta sp.]|nr:hypothetical protein [Spirochaeta sp.]